MAWLWARSSGAEVVLRVEDLDGPRTKAGAAAEAVADLRWLGLDWDGEELHQSTRGAAYEEALERLRAAGRVYPCGCTRKEIEAARSAPNEGDAGPRYPGTCRDQEPPAEREPAWRFRVDEERETSFVDLVRGPERAHPGQVEGDFVIAKKSGEAAYQLAVVVDDAYQGISDVIRGDDLVPSTHLQLLLYEALGAPPPRFAHLPLVRGPDGRRLAKRHGDTRIAHYRELGVTPERILGLLAHWSGLAPLAPLSLPELLATCAGGLDWSRLPRQDPRCGSAEDAWLRTSS